jgi:hypothetical protein
VVKQVLVGVASNFISSLPPMVHSWSSKLLQYVVWGLTQEGQSSKLLQYVVWGLTQEGHDVKWFLFCCLCLLLAFLVWRNFSDVVIVLAGGTAETIS